jgi:hypothetical protein
MLTAVVIIYFGVGYPASKAVLSVDFLLSLFLLTVIANVAYCSAYRVDIFVQASGFRELWQRYRWVLFAIGTTFAAVITRFVAMGSFIAAVNSGTAHADALTAEPPSARTERVAIPTGA